MKLVLKRAPSSDKSTIGRLYIDGVEFCRTLEDVVRDKKIPGETAIPAGTYQVKITYSPRFKRDLPLLIDVPGFEGVRIHTGNVAANTEGCILVGKSAGQDIIWQSQMAFNELFAKLKAADNISIEIQEA